MSTSRTCRQIFVFDVDGTLVADNIGTTFAKYLIKTRSVQMRSLCAMLPAFLLYKARLIDFSWMIRAGAWASAGLRTDDVAMLAERCFAENIRPHLYPKAIEEIKRVSSLGGIVYLATGAHKPIAEALAKHLGADGLVAAESIIEHERYTMKLIHPLPFLDGKRDLVLHAIGQRDDVELTVYTDEEKDLPLLRSADNCVAVNADKRITEYVKSRRGKLLHFT